MSDRYRGRHRRRSLRAPLALLLALLALVGLTLPGAYGGYFARVTNNANSASSNPYFTCAAAQAGTTPSAYFTYPFSETGGVTANDISPTTRNGAYSTALNLGVTPVGVTYNVNNSGANAVCPRDKRNVITLNGSSGFVSGPNTAVAGPNVFSIEIWFKTSSNQGGKLIGFGNNRNTLSGSYDRHLYIDSNGKLVFGVYPNSVQTLTSSASVNDGQWHHGVGTLSSAGMALYLDGQQVGTNAAVTTAQAFTGYWRIGWDNLSGWTNTPTSNYFSGSLAFASVYTSALSATQVAQHYAAGD